ncbi:MAG: HIT family protein [Betaproteobacteria bacterium]
MRSMNTCELCTSTGGTLLWQSEQCRVVRVDDPDYPGFCRVVWNAHISEITDLPPDQRMELMAVVFAVEAVVRSLFQPDKINLASFGNMTPHLHWHIIPRWRQDKNFPESIWGRQQRTGAVPVTAVSDRQLADALLAALAGPGREITK